MCYYLVPKNEKPSLSRLLDFKTWSCPEKFNFTSIKRWSRTKYMKSWIIWSTSIYIIVLLRLLPLKWLCLVSCILAIVLDYSFYLHYLTELSISSLLRVGEKKYIGPYEDNTRRRRNLRACSSLSKNQCMRLRLPCRWDGYMCVRLTHSGGQQTVSSHEAARAACRKQSGRRGRCRRTRGCRYHNGICSYVGSDRS